MNQEVAAIKRALRQMMRRCGFDLIRFAPSTHNIARRKRLFETYGIEAVIDVGANVGQYARELRSFGYHGQIYSFEPLSVAFQILHRNAENDEAWTVFNYALGDESGSRTINIASNSFSSSILEMLPSHVQAVPQSKYVGTEVIEIRTLDSIFTSIRGSHKNILLKIDTQGFEKKVVIGAEGSLPSIDTLQVELSLVPLYRGEASFDEICRLLASTGYLLVSLEPGRADPESGRLLQVDGIFHRG